MATPITNKSKELILKENIQTSSSCIQNNLKISDSEITDNILKKISDDRIKNIELINCTMTKKVAETLVASGTKETVVFKQCMLSDKKNQIIDNTGLYYRPLPEEFLAKLDAPDEIVVMQEARPDVTEEQLEKEIAYAQKLVEFVHTRILPKITVTINEGGIDRIIRQSESGIMIRRDIRLDKIAYSDLEGLKERIFTCIAALDHIIERYNKYTDHNNLLFDQISLENQNLTDVLYNGTNRGRFTVINQNRLVLDENSLLSDSDLCQEAVEATTRYWGR